MSDPADLLRVLARVRVARPAELQAALGVSQATLSRLVARAGTQIFRMGRGRATQYTRTALATVDAAGVRAARAQRVDIEGWRCLEVERFDRIGERGRRAVVSLARRDSWTAAAGRLAADPFSLPSREATQMRWLDAFGQLIGNTDRHFGNIAFFVESDATLRLAPVYDMLPMILAPVNDTLVARDFQPAPPGGDNLDVWSDAAAWAERYWGEVQANRALHDDVRAFAADATLAVATLLRRVAPGRADARD
jgi:hypothetical protein